MKKFTLRFEDEKLHEAFKIKTIKDKSNMQQVLIAMVQKYVKGGCQ